MNTLDPRQPDIRHSNQNAVFIVLILAGLLGLGVTFNVASDKLWLLILVGVINVAVVGVAVWKNPQLFKGRSAANGANSTIMVVLTLAILVVINFVAVRFPLKRDVTRNQLHTLSDQTQKLAEGLKQPLKLTLFASPGIPGDPRMKLRPMLENLRHLNSKIEFEFSDPTKDVVRSRALGLKKQGTLVIEYLGRNSKIEEVTEEKLTNALIKITKDKTPTVCSLIGNGQKSIKATEPDGFSAVQKAMSDQSYESKEISVLLEGSIPENCDAIFILGANRPLLPKEVDSIRKYLEQGGRAIITLESNPKGTEDSPELIKLLAEWGVQPMQAMIIDAAAANSPQLGNSGTLAIVPSYSKESAITKNFGAAEQTVFPMSRPLDIAANLPASLKVRWIAQTHDKTWAENDFKNLAIGKAALTDQKKKGPLSVALEVSGKQKDSTAKRDTRLVVFGSTQFANNQFGQIGVNRDFFMNSLSWLLDDDSLISIRKKDDDSARIEMSPMTPAFLFWGLVLGVPLMVGTAGVLIWLVRRRK